MCLAVLLVSQLFLLLAHRIVRLHQSSPPFIDHLITIRPTPSILSRSIISFSLRMPPSIISGVYDDDTGSSWHCSYNDMLLSFYAFFQCFLSCALSVLCLCYSSLCGFISVSSVNTSFSCVSLFAVMDTLLVILFCLSLYCFQCVGSLCLLPCLPSFCMILRFFFLFCVAANQCSFMPRKRHSCRCERRSPSAAISSCTRLFSYRAIKC